MYRRIARIYKLSPKDIAELTPYQQAVLCGGGDDDLTFDTWDDYLAWEAQRKKS